MDPNVLVGNETSDDAGAYLISEDLAIVQSVDYFTPIVDDPYMFGQIAAANALSDIYAMGAVPKTALNIVGFPIKKLPKEMLVEILRGAQDKVKEAGAVIIGGHSIDDQEPKFGMSVTGFVHPDKIYKNIGAKIGDVLVLTKPIGVGILTTGIKREVVTNEQEQLVTKTMATLNKLAAETLAAYHPHAVTDVTGFGLLGHAFEMANGSEVSFTISMASVPVLEGTLQLAKDGVIPGGSKANMEWLRDDVSYVDSLSEAEKVILCDAITSGGLLISMEEKEAEQYVRDMIKLDQTAHIIGAVTKKNPIGIHVTQ
jgi:selenide,water dikinase